ncbi:histidine kinase [Streptomyces sp. NBC_00287]|uniref:histidine kinase n=1 Tax=Streptomyces sp. NBC_00287 TaxID=2975702 RepID=UPI002E2CC255|nr:histidine kinase [Streptomyces sp. NBC_00287]
MPVRLLRPGIGRAVLFVATSAYAAGAATVMVGGTDSVTSYAQVSAPFAALSLVPGLCLLLAGQVVRQPPLARVRVPLLLLGVVWLAPLWAGWQGHTPVRSLLHAPGEGPALLRVIALAMSPFAVAALVHLAVAARPVRHARALTISAYGTAGVIFVSLVLFHDPYLDVHCWRVCAIGPTVLHADPHLTQAVQAASAVFVAAAGVLLALAVAADAAAHRAVRPTEGPYLQTAVAVAGLAEAAYAATLLAHRAEDPIRQPFAGLFVIRAAALALVVLALGRLAVRQRRRRIAVARLADELGAAPPPGSLQAALADALGDARLEVLYRLPASDSYVDATGAPAQPAPGRERVLTAIHRGGEPIAVVVHDRADAHDRHLEQQIGSAARLAIDNERLRASLLARLAELRSARARIVETGDEARRRLERDLHDGAQQWLLAVTYELRLAHNAAVAAGDPRAPALAHAVEEALAVLAELRDTAHGIFPVVLYEAGLEPALWTLADRATVPVQIGAVPPERLPHAVERAAYAVVGAAVDAAEHQGAPCVEIRVERGPAIVVVHLEGVRLDPYDRVADRVGALGGWLENTEYGTRAGFPCD